MRIKPRILYISSASPVKGPGTIGWGHVRLLKEAGYEVDMLTLFKERSLPEVMFVKENDLRTRIIDRFKRLFVKQLPGAPYCFFYKKETEPPVSIDRVIKKIVKPYDLLMIYFWQEMLSFRTVEAIYDKLNHPVVFFLSPDYSHMSGGCHFTCDCLRYQTGCGCCPAINSRDENDFTHWNVLYRKRFYEKVKPVVFGNSYMKSFYQKSFLLKDARVSDSLSMFNVAKFKPLDSFLARSKMGVPSNDAFVIAFGSQALSDPRKGFDYLIDALNIFKKRLSDQECAQIQLLAAGADFIAIRNKLPFRSIGTGLLAVEDLPFFYSAANIFVCPSIDDAGPSMVAQAISCGIPVVGFKMGAMLDRVLDKGTGYCAELMDSNDLANGMERFYRMSKAEYDAISKRCRQYAIDNSHGEKKVKRWMELYEMYRS